MDKKVTLDKLASELNISKTTISKAINNCPGITPHTKSTVMDAVCASGYRHTRARSGKIATVLPSVPNYFWGNIRKRLGEQCRLNSISCTCYVYSGLSDTEDALKCINRALAEDISVLILAAPDSTEIKARLEAVATDILIILIEEFLDIKNAFFVGEDSFAQGQSLGKKYINDHKDIKSFALLKCTDSYTENKRIDGFLSALDNADIPAPTSIVFDSSSPAKAAELARLLSALSSLPECIFCPSGNALTAALAVKKLKTNKTVHCIGFDLNGKNDLSIYDGILTHILLQDTDRQASTAIGYAVQFLKHRIFPPAKNTYIGCMYYNKKVEH